MNNIKSHQKLNSLSLKTRRLLGEDAEAFAGFAILVA